MKKIITSTVLALCLLSVTLKAQDIHYSQFYASPLTLNPALTGVIDGQYRIGAMYRNQWASVSNNPYVTPSISFDWNGIAPKFFKTWVFSAGLLILDDKSGDGSLQNLNVTGSFAFRRFIDKAGKNNISLGGQIGYNQESVNLNALTFENEFTGTGFNTSAGSGETGLTNTSTSFLTINAGALYTSKISKTVDFYGGVAGFNLNQPKETFFSSGSNTLASREIIHGGFRIALSSKVSLLPAALFMTQASATEFDLGTSLSYLIKGNSNDATLFIGGYDRINDAIIAMVGMEYRGVRVGVSYDINTSSLTAATNDKGGFEISLTYIGLFSLINEKPVLFCPRY